MGGTLGIPACGSFHRIGYIVAMSDETSAEDRKPEPQITPDKPGDGPGPGTDQDETDQMPDTMTDDATE
jgi:hypothetical protein